MFYDNYVLACELRGKKPTPVAQELGCTSSNVAQWKKGSTPRSAVLQKIAAYLDVTPQWLVFGDEGPDGDGIKKQHPADSEALTETQKYAFDMLKTMDDSEIKLLIDIFKTVRANREQRKSEAST